MRFAIIGKGFIYPRHVQAIEGLGHEVVWTCDNNPATDPTFTDWLEMYNHPSFEGIDAVSICTPNYLHPAMIREALLRGKKVLCEKPLAIDGLYDGLDGVNVVLQLRYHKEIQRLSRPKEIYVEAKMYRNEVYWNGWKGDPVKSGGVLFNLGVHYIDLAIFLLGNDYEIIESEVGQKLGKATVKFGDSIAKFHIEIVDNPDQQGRKLLADGKEITLSNQENLSYEDLHKYVYADFINGNGIPLSEAQKALDLVHKIYANSV